MLNKKFILLIIFILVQFLAPDSRAYETVYETWNSKPFGTSQTLTWCYKNFGKDLQGNNVTPVKYILSKEYDKDIQKAFSKWEAVANITFIKETTSRCTSDIKISASRNSNKKEEIARSYYPMAIHDDKNKHFNGDIFLDIDENWNEINLLPVMMHEIGHSIGLLHSKEENSIMSPLLDQHITSLKIDDIKGVQHIYGATISNYVSLKNSNVLMISP